MKKSKILTLSLLALLSAAPALGQTAYNGKVSVSQEQFTRQGRLLRVRFHVAYGDDVASPGETLTLTPVLKNDTVQQTLSAVVVKGDDLRPVNRLQGNYPVAGRAKAKGKSAKGAATARHSFVYDTTVPYAAWMQGAGLYFESQRDKGEGNRHTFEDNILGSVTVVDDTTRDVRPRVDVLAEGILARVRYLSPATEASKITTVAGVMPLTREEVHSSKFNGEVYQYIMSVAGKQGGGRPLVGVRLHGFGAPEGNYHATARMGMDRQLWLRDYLLHQKGTAAARCRVDWTPEDWDSIVTIVRGSTMRYRNAVLDIIRATDVADGRESNLKTLAKGQPYNYLEHHVFDKVYRMAYTLDFAVPDADSITGAVTPDNDRSQLTYANLFGVAESYGRGSTTFRELMAMGARLFPNSAEANINAGAAALVDGRTDDARRLLEPYASDPRAYDDLGVLYTLLGRRDRAEVYFRLAGFTANE